MGALGATCPPVDPWTTTGGQKNWRILSFDSGEHLSVTVSKEFCSWRRRKHFPSLKAAPNFEVSTRWQLILLAHTNSWVLTFCLYLKIASAMVLPRCMFSLVPVSHLYFCQFLSFTQFVLQSNSCVYLMFPVEGIRCVEHCHLVMVLSWCWTVLWKVSSEVQFFFFFLLRSLSAKHIKWLCWMHLSSQSVVTCFLG